MKKNDKGLTLFLTAICLVMLSGCSGAKDASVVTINGSTSVNEIMESKKDKIGIVEAYQAVRPDIRLRVSPTGSSDGIKAAIEGSADIGMTSRKLNPEEKVGLTETVVAIDGIALVVHPDNPVQNLTREQLRDIYLGKITNWNQVGGDDVQISVVARESGSGTRGAFEELLGIKDKMVDSATQFNGTGAIKAEVSQNKHAIGYISEGAIDSSVKPLDIEGYAPTVENIRAGSYLIKRKFIFIYNEETLTQQAREFIEWVISSEGQAVVEKKGFISVID